MSNCNTRNKKFLNGPIASSEFIRAYSDKSTQYSNNFQACEHTVFCQAKSPGKSQSLFPLMDYRQNVELSIGSEESFFFSMCKPLADHPGLNCPNEAAVCSAIKDQKSGWKVMEINKWSQLLKTKVRHIDAKSPSFNQLYFTIYYHLARCKINGSVQICEAKFCSYLFTIALRLVQTSWKSAVTNNCCSPLK